jgi:hypothetical protein
LGLICPAILSIFTMWRVWAFTVDDAYISFRYARNLVAGHGLVYNPGEYVEGYSNFLWTVLIAGGMALGIDPVLFSKLLGAAAALGMLACVYWMANRLLPFGRLPCVSTWLLASSLTTSGWAIFGLETAAFTALCCAGIALYLREREDAGAFPWSGLVFAAAGLTRPEAPLFIGLAVLFLGRRMFERQNLIRVALFVVPVLSYLLWRHGYYGEWLPNTAMAKTGAPKRQLRGGAHYLLDYALHVGPVFWAPLVAAWIAFRKRNWTVWLLMSIGLCWMVYILIIGKDWMPFYRFMAPIEPYWFLLAGLTIRTVAAAGHRLAFVVVVLFLGFVTVQRGLTLRAAQNKILRFHEPYWREIYGDVANWYLAHPPGLIAIGDLGYFGYATDAPILDLIGLTDKEISKFEGGYARKLGKDYRDYVFSREPAYFVFSPNRNGSCRGQFFKLHRRIARDTRFYRYYLAGEPGSEKFGPLCVFALRDLKPQIP